VMEEATLRQEGEFWTITFRGATCHLQDVRGLTILAWLLRHPSEWIAARELVFMPPRARRARSNGRTSEGEAQANERARVNATRALTAVIRKMEAHLPALAAHLAGSLRTGARCAYLPDPQAAIAWTIGDGAPRRESPQATAATTARSGRRRS
jgi:hypothetical protein